MEVEEIRDGLGPMQRWERDVVAPETATVIVQRVAEGEGLKGICKSRGWPYSLVAQWIATEPELAAAYEAALAIWVDALAHETVAISDEQALVVTKHGVPFDPDVSRDALRVKARQWAAEKLARQRYGAKMQHEHRHTVDLGERLRRARERVLPAGAVEVEDAEIIASSPMSTSEVI